MKTIVNELDKKEKVKKENVIDWDNLDNIPEEKPITNADDLDADLSDYKNASVNIADEAPEPEEEPADAEAMADAPPNIDPVTGLDKNLYFVSGKKKGQLRKKARLSYNPTKPATLNGQFLTGAIMLTLVDILLPLLFAGINNTLSKKKIDPDKLKLTTEQKKEFEPVADAVLKSIKFEANPVLVLSVGLLGAYGINYFMLKNES